MPALTFTADHTTGQLTIPAHGMLTGDGAAGVIAAGGALPAGGALTEAGSYWVIRVDADHLKLATSNADALAGTAVSFSDNGSGTMFLLVNLPFRVPRIAAPLTQIRHEDFNAEWGSMVRGGRAPFRRNIPLTPTFIDTTSTWAQNGSGIKSTSTTGTTIGGSYIDCPYDLGDQILGIEVWRRSDGTGGAKECQLVLSAGGANIIATITTDSIASGATTHAMLVVPASIAVGHAMAEGESLRFSFVGKTNTGYIIDLAQLVVMRS
ncbi:MAG TPA: hypothetical protein VHW23_45965 [Kofleriaceae bacterium]|jgi:hypothetical protein|nr:hypothetical protein [Kofleriaceae bacterium]